MINLDQFWDFIWCRPGLSASIDEWRRCLGDEGWQVLRKPLFVGDGIAQTCVDAEGRILQVVPMSRGTYGLICPTTGNCEQRGLREDDVRAYRLNVGALRRLVSDALGIATDSQAIRELPNAFPLGNWTPMKGVDIPAFIILPPTTALLASEIDQLLLQYSGGFILFTPKQPSLANARRARFEQQRSMIVPLSEVVACDVDGHLSVLPSWETYQSAYCQRHLADQTVSAEPGYVFEWDGDSWRLVFDGGCTTIKNIKGTRLLATLLSNPCRDLYCPDIRAQESGNPILKVNEFKDVITDDAAKKAYKNKLQEWEEELADAKACNDYGRQAAAQENVDSLKEHLLRLHGYNGRTRKFSTNAERARKAVRKNIITILNGEGMSKLPKAQRHFNNCISFGTFICYAPEEEIDWVIRKKSDATT